ncbi:hypothetical protein ACVWWG_005386 [Bradyrhizobium sp. LB7.2]
MRSWPERAYSPENMRCASEMITVLAGPGSSKLKDPRANSDPAASKFGCNGVFKWRPLKKHLQNIQFNFNII